MPSLTAGTPSIGTRRCQHKADRRGYVHAQQIADVLLWEKIEIPALVIKGSLSTRFGPEEMSGSAPTRQRATETAPGRVPLVRLAGREPGKS